MYSEHELEIRESLIRYFTRFLETELNRVNSAFRFIRIETPIVLDVESLVLREDTVKAAHDVSHDILSGKLIGKQRLPFVVWQHGKVFHRDKGGLVKEVYSLEYQVLFGKTTGMDYLPIISEACNVMLVKQCGPISPGTGLGVVRVHAADNNDVLVSIQERPDFWAGKNIEVVVNLDSCTQAFLRHENSARTSDILTSHLS